MENKRKKKLIDKPFQFGMIVKLIGINCLVMIIFGILIYFFLQSEVESNLASAHTVYKNVSEMILPVVITLTGLNLIIMGILSSVSVIYSSHRIAGPMFRFKAALNDMGRGDLTTLTRIREKDQLLVLSEELSNVADRYSADLQKIKECADKGDLDTIKEVVESYKLN